MRSPSAASCCEQTPPVAIDVRGGGRFAAYSATLALAKACAARADAMCEPAIALVSVGTVWVDAVVLTPVSA